MVENGKCFPTGWNVAAKLCDSCESTVALLFCRKDTLFLCVACDDKLHHHTRHERVWMCEVCEQAPACVTCKADAAALCVTCDRDIHTVNPLARRHERIPVVPFYDSSEAVVKSITGNFLDQVSGYRSTELNNSATKEDNNGWGFPTDTGNTNVKISPDASAKDMKSMDLFAAADRLFDFGFSIPTEVRLESQFRDSADDGVVPVQAKQPTKDFPQAQSVDHPSTGTRYEIDFTGSTINSNNRSSSQSLNHSVSSSLMDVGVVPEQNSALMLHVEPSGGTNCSEKAKQLSGTDREARVLRYREKRKNRRFEKTIRYASRKAYAEMRPRIKGRFAKRAESTTELDVDGWLLTTEPNANSYGVVPSF